MKLLNELTKKITIRFPEKVKDELIFFKFI